MNEKILHRNVNRCISYNKLIVVTGIIVEIALVIIGAPPTMIISMMLPIIVAIANILLLKLHNFRGILSPHKPLKIYKLRQQKLMQSLKANRR